MNLRLNESSESILVDSMHIGTQELVLFPNESPVRTNQVNEWFSDKISTMPSPNGSLSFICKV